MQHIIGFLRQLSAHNDREWFAAHKAEYTAVQARFVALTEQLIGRIGAFDDTIAPLSVKDCTYRIYRDTRFSNDKSPYKTHMGCFLCRGGKKSGYSGYYFHIGVDEKGEYPAAHMLASGNYCIEPRALQILREDITIGQGDFEQTLQVADPRFVRDESYKLKRPPKGYDETSPYIDLRKYKVFCLCSDVTTAEMTAPDVVEHVAAMFETTKPFVDYVNRAIEYARHEQP